MFQVPSPQPPTPQPSAGSELCLPKPASIPIRYFISSAVPPPEETVELALDGAVIVNVLVVTVSTSYPAFLLSVSAVMPPVAVACSITT